MVIYISELRKNRGKGNGSQSEKRFTEHLTAWESYHLKHFRMLSEEAQEDVDFLAYRHMVNDPIEQVAWCRDVVQARLEEIERLQKDGRPFAAAVLENELEHEAEKHK